VAPGGTTGPDPAKPATADRSARKRLAIMEAATALFLQHGYLGTSVDQIALRAAVSKPTVYRFFADKEQLFTEIVLSTLDRAGEPFRAELASLARTDRLDADLRQLARRYLQTVMQPRVLQLRRLVIGASADLPALARSYYERAPEQTILAIAECFARLTERNLLRTLEPGSAASQFAFLVLGQALDKALFCGDRPFTAAELRAQADAAVTTFLSAYGV
jgi:TetR/AcrR family transcriptional repressor of mexJK operon